MKRVVSLLRKIMGHHRTMEALSALTRGHDRTMQTLSAIQERAEKLHERLGAIESSFLTGSTLDDEISRSKTQAEPLQLPRVPGSFWIKVKVDHDGIFAPHGGDYVYHRVKDVIDSNTDCIDEWVKRIDPILSGPEIARIPQEQESSSGPYWNNPMFRNGDPRVLYALIAAAKPNKIVEVGSGDSTTFMRRAIDDFRLPTRLVAVDPSPRRDVEGAAHQLIKKSVWDAPLDLFTELESGDILFWDGSHIAFNGTDTTHLFLNILPVIKKGVLVHIHDIQLPNEYERGYSAHYYNEQYMLGTLVLHSDKWTPMLPLHYLGVTRRPDLKGCSWWMIRN